MGYSVPATCQAGILKGAVVGGECWVLGVQLGSVFGPVFVFLLLLGLKMRVESQTVHL